MASRADLVLVVGFIAALGLGAYELRRASGLSLPPAPPDQPAQPLAPLEVPPDVVRSIAAYDTIVERPLFNSNRRPRLATAEPGQTESSRPREERVEIDGFRLTAVLRHADKTTVLIEDRSGKTLTLQAGERLGSWRLDEILDDRVVLIADGRRETLMVYDFSRTTVVAAPVRGVNRRPTRRTIERPAIARPAIARPAIARPEIARPEIARPEIARPEIERQAIERPPIQRPAPSARRLRPPQPEQL